MEIKMKIKLFSLATFFLVLLIPEAVYAATTVNLFQVTSEGSQQTTPYIYQDLVVYGSLGEIWGYDLRTQENFEIFSRAGGQFVTDFSENLVIYEDTPEGESTSDVRMYNVKMNEDELVVGGAGAQTSGVTNGNYIVYIDGGACGDILAYHIKKKTDDIISLSGCHPLRISGNIVGWPQGAVGGTNIYGYDLSKSESLDVVIENDFQEAPNIYNNYVIWHHYISGGYGDYQAIKMKNLKTDEVKILYETNTDSLGAPAISNRYAVWSQSPSQHVNKIMGADLKTGEVFEVQPAGSHQNSHTSPSIWRDTAAWMSFRTGSGDIY